MEQAAFLILLPLGILTLVGGLVWTRLNWRPDVAPYSRHTRSVDVAVHPERYAKEQALGRIRALNLLGAVLLASAVGILMYEALRVAAERGQWAR